MDEKVKQLIEKYYQGLTSPEEERTLREYFRENPDESPEGMWFSFINQERDNKMDKPLTEIENPEQEVTLRPRTGKSWILTLAAAASFALIITLYIWEGNMKKNDVYSQIEVTDKEEARLQAENALYFLSAKLNQPINGEEKKSIYKETEYFLTTASKKLNTGLNTTKELNKFEKVNKEYLKFIY